MQGAGNDYVYVDVRGAAALPFDPARLARAVSPRRLSIGADGLVLICDADVDAGMRIFNADGSEAGMCGNALRCVADYLYGRGEIGPEAVIATASGDRRVFVRPDGRIGAEGGRAAFGGVVSADMRDRDEITVSASGQIITVVPVDMGNPHAVVFCDDPDAWDIRAVGGALGEHPLFPDGVNCEFVAVESPDSLRVRVWERGSGETLACGTGACAAVAAAQRKGRVRCEGEVAVIFPGGRIGVTARDGVMYMTGDAVKVCEGVFEYDESKAE